MISTGMFVCMVMVWLTLLIVGILDLNNRAYMNVVAMVVDSILSGYLALVVSSGDIIEPSTTVINGVMYNYSDGGLGWFFGFATFVIWIITGYLIYEAAAEYIEGRRVASEEGY